MNLLKLIPACAFLAALPASATTAGSVRFDGITIELTDLATGDGVTPFIAFVGETYNAKMQAETFCAGGCTPQRITLLNRQLWQPHEARIEDVAIRGAGFLSGVGSPATVSLVSFGEAAAATAFYRFAAGFAVDFVVSAGTGVRILAPTQATFDSSGGNTAADQPIMGVSHARFRVSDPALIGEPTFGVASSVFRLATHSKLCLPGEGCVSRPGHGASAGLLDLSWENNSPGSHLYTFTGRTNLAVTSIPEPATYAMMLGGLGLLLASRQRKS